MFNTCDNIIDS